MCVHNVDMEVYYLFFFRNYFILDRVSLRGNVAKPKVDEPNPEPFRFYFTLGETDIMLVEDVELIDTNGLVLNVNYITLNHMRDEIS